MRALIIQSEPALCHLWASHLQRAGLAVSVAHTGAEAMAIIDKRHLDVIVVDLVLRDCSAITLSEFAQFRQPDANLVFVTDTTFFSDGSIFAHAANARAMVETATPPEDLAAIVQYYAMDASRAHAAH